MLKEFDIFSESLSTLPTSKLLINTINAYSYNMSQKDKLFKEALLKCDVLIPDGVGIVWAMRFLYRKKIKKIAGADLFYYEMQRLEKSNGKCFFLGSSEDTLSKILNRAKLDYPNVQVSVYSPPYKKEFSKNDNQIMLERVNAFSPDVLFVGMTAPKQEKWAYTNLNKLNTGHICSIGAVFDFYAGSIKRAPDWMIYLGLEWFYRLLKEPKRLWRRYIIGNTIFLFAMFKGWGNKSN